MAFFSSEVCRTQLWQRRSSQILWKYYNAQIFWIYSK